MRQQDDDRGRPRGRAPQALRIPPRANVHPKLAASSSPFRRRSASSEESEPAVNHRNEGNPDRLHADRGDGVRGRFGSRDQLAKIGSSAEPSRIAEQRGGEDQSRSLRREFKVEKRHISDTELIEGDRPRQGARAPPHADRGRTARIASPTRSSDQETEIESKINIKNPSQIQSFLDEEDKSFRWSRRSTPRART